MEILWKEVIEYLFNLIKGITGDAGATPLTSRGLGPDPNMGPAATDLLNAVRVQRGFRCDKAFVYDPNRQRDLPRQGLSFSENPQVIAPQGRPGGSIRAAQEAGPEEPACA
jgi:hypothetical protein